MGKGNRTRLATQAEIEKKAQQPAPKQPVGKTVRNVLIGVLVAAFVGVGIFGLLAQSGALSNMLTAFEVGSQKITAKEYKVYYKTAEMNLLNNYGTMLQMYYGVDLTKPLETQAYGEGTWGDYLNEETQRSLTDTYTLYQEALEQGYAVADENDVRYQGQMGVYRAMAELYDMDLDEYVKTVYGSGVKVADLQNSAKVTATALNYYNDYINNIDVSEDEIQEYYINNSTDFDLVDYRSFTIPYETVTYTAPAEGETVKEGEPSSQEEADAQTEQNRAEAQAQADKILARVHSEEDFINEAKSFDGETYADADSTLTTGAALSNATTTNILGWTADIERVKGDTTSLDTSNNITVAYFLQRYLPEVPTATVRHLLLNASEPSESATDEEKAEAQEKLAAAETKINEIKDEFLAGEQTEQAFASLAAKYSQDSGSVADGGLLKDFAEGDMVEEFNDWCFDASRQPGDVEVVKTSYGYHLIYFIGSGDSDWKAQSRQQIVDTKYNEYYATLDSKYPTVVHDYGVSLAY